MAIYFLHELGWDSGLGLCLWNEIWMKNVRQYSGIEACAINHLDSLEGRHDGRAAGTGLTRRGCGVRVWRRKIRAVGI
jgi:hypothetical protein